MKRETAKTLRVLGMFLVIYCLFSAFALLPHPVQAMNAVTTTVAVGRQPVCVAITPNGAYAYVTNEASGSISVISTASNTVTATIAVGRQPYGVAITPNGTYAYVANQGDNTVSVISTASNTVKATVTVGSYPVNVAITPDGVYAYVANEGNSTVSVISTASNTVTATITVGTNPYGVAVTPNGAYVYVTNYGSGTVMAINTTSNMVTATITVGSQPLGVAITPDSAYAYVTNYQSDIVSVISTGSNTVTKEVTVRGAPYSVAVAPNGAYVYLTNYDNITVLATASNTLTATLTVGGNPSGLAITPDSAYAYFTDTVDDTVSIIETQLTIRADSWVSKAPMHVARAGLGVAVVNNKIYAIGGSTESPSQGPPTSAYPNINETVGVNEEYDPVTDTWVFKSPMPTPRTTFAIAVYQGKVYCIGGFNQSTSLLVNEVYDPATDSWETKAPAPEAGPKAAVIDRKIYVIGAGGTNVLHLQAYDPETDSWSEKKPVPIDLNEGLRSSTMTGFENKIFFLAAWSYLTYSLPTYIYDPKTDSWSTSNTRPPIQVFGSAATTTTGAYSPKRLYLIGTLNWAKTPQELFPNQIYNPTQDNWTVGASMPTGRIYFGFVNLDDTLYAIGGYQVGMYPFDTGYTTGGILNASSANEQYKPFGYVAPTPTPSPSLSPSPSPLARVIKTLKEQGRTNKTSLATSTSLSYDRLVKYLAWMSDKGLVQFDSNDDVNLTKLGAETYDDLVKWILQYVGKVRFPKFS